MPIHTWVPGVKTLDLPAGPVPYYAGIGRVAVNALLACFRSASRSSGRRWQLRL